MKPKNLKTIHRTLLSIFILLFSLTCTYANTKKLIFNTKSELFNLIQNDKFRGEDRIYIDDKFVPAAIATMQNDYGLTKDYYNLDEACRDKVYFGITFVFSRIAAIYSNWNGRSNLSSETYTLDTLVSASFGHEKDKCNIYEPILRFKNDFVEMLKSNVVNREAQHWAEVDAKNASIQEKNSNASREKLLGMVWITRSQMA